MNDCIRRQAAIDDIKAIYEYHDTVTEDRIIDHLKRLPSAEVTLCHLGSPCEYQNADIAMPSAQQWIPVTEGLPEDNEYVLVTTAEGGVTNAKYWYRERIWVKDLAIMHVTAWMPLPEPWKGEG